MLTIKFIKHNNIPNVFTLFAHSYNYTVYNNYYHNYNAITHNSMLIQSQKVPVDSPSLI